MNSETITALVALSAALVALGIPKLWDIIKMWMGFDADGKKLRIEDAIVQRGEWREEVATLRRKVGDLEKSIDEWQAKYWELKMDHRDCTLKTETLAAQNRMLEARISVLESGHNVE